MRDLLAQLGMPTAQRGITFINGKLSAMPGLQPDLDHVLNYMFMDQTVPYKNVEQQFDDQRLIQITTDTPIGQTFRTGPETGIIARVRAHLRTRTYPQPAPVP